MTTPIDGIEACVFDAYGTLFDFNSATERCRDLLGDRTDRLSEVWRQKQLQYTWLRSLMGRHEDFWQVTGEALDFALAAVGLDDPVLRQRLLDLYLELEPYPEVVDTLRRLRTAPITTAILSNGAPDMLAAAVRSAGIQDLVDDILSVESVGVYKPHPDVYQLAVDRLAVPARAICFQSANGWDAVGAASFGFRVVWINRFGQPSEFLPARPDAVVSSLADLPGLLQLD